MSENIAPFSITAPGFFGLNTADSPTELDQKFALDANNCVIDKSGRVASRKGWTPHHAASTDLGTSDVECIGELVINSGVVTLLAAGNGKLFKWASGTPDTLVTLTYGGGATAPTISANNWTFCQLNGIAMFWQRGYDPLIYDPAVSATTFRRLSEKSGTAGTIYKCHVAITAYGRVWCADNGTDKQTLVWSDLLTPHIWTGGTSGSLDLRQVWPNGSDEIMALAAHNNFLFIFGRRQILVYSGADDPATMKLSDSVDGIGCAGRDTVQTIGSDVIFLSETGVRSVQRTIQEKSAPIKTFSRNVNDDVIQYLGSTISSDSIKSTYSRSDNFYLLSFTQQGATYCFDLRSQLQDGSSRATTWTGVKPKSYWYSVSDQMLYIGVAGYISEYNGYYDNTSQYRMSYYTSWLDFGDPIRTSILKRILMTIFGAFNQDVSFKWRFDYSGAAFSQDVFLTDESLPAEYGVSEYGIAEYASGVVTKSVGVPASGSGRSVQIGFECQVHGFPISIQRIDIYSKEGRF